VLTDVEYRIDRNPPQSGEWARLDSGDDLFWLHAPLTEVLDGQTLLIRVRTLDGGLIDDESRLLDSTARCSKRIVGPDCSSSVQASNGVVDLPHLDVPVYGSLVDIVRR
jgi:hypothetical protein